MDELLTVEQMGRADRLASLSGVAGLNLMEAAGWAVAREVWRRFPKGRVSVLCGPGNNGGDGFVCARHLAARGFAVRLALLGEVKALKGDAAVMAGRWSGGVRPMDTAILERADLVVDALFGAGLSRPIDGLAKTMIEAVIARKIPVVAVDVPSGVDGDTGSVLGTAADAVATVTFFRKKPGHLLYPGRAKCGAVRVADIGIPPGVLAEIRPQARQNGPAVPPVPAVAAHKYTRGHLLIAGGGIMTGAARLAARAARRIGAGLATIAAPAEALAIYRAGDPGVIVQDRALWAELLADSRRNAVLVGPGCGSEAAGLARAALAAGRPCVLDADALTPGPSPAFGDGSADPA